MYIAELESMISRKEVGAVGCSVPLPAAEFT